MKEHVVITIGREYCSGGRFIAQKIAQDLNIPFYDKELITLAAKKSGLSEAAIAASEKQRSSSLLYNLYTMGSSMPLADQVFVLQSQIIRELAQQGPCVILGRCGDYVLREQPNVLKTYVYASMDTRKEFAAQWEAAREESAANIQARIEKEDRKRASYYNYYTQHRWGEAGHYDLCLNADLGRDICAEIIEHAYLTMEAKLK